MPKHKHEDQDRKRPTGRPKVKSLAKLTRTQQQVAAQREARRNPLGKPLRYCVETTHRQSEERRGRP